MRKIFYFYSLVLHFFNFTGLRNFYKTYYLPQHCLYFFPDPQVEANLVYIVFMVFTILLLFQRFADSVI